MLKKALLVAACMAAAFGGIATAEPSVQADSGCFLNGSPVPDFQADNAVFGTNGADVIDCTASPKARTIFANNGNDRVLGSSFNDTIHGGFGNDSLFGRGGNDFIAGEGGNDSMSGGSGTDRCVGSDGVDTASSCESVVSVP